jgi:hypothetical protein
MGLALCPYENVFKKRKVLWSSFYDTLSGDNYYLVHLLIDTIAYYIFLLIINKCIIYMFCSAYFPRFT